jgi:hypothetical protein
MTLRWRKPPFQEPISGRLQRPQIGSLGHEGDVGSRGTECLELGGFLNIRKQLETPARGHHLQAL